MKGQQHKPLVRMGRVGRAYGIKGWVKVQSFAESPVDLLDYQPWQLCNPAGGAAVPADVLEGKIHGPGLVVRFAHSEDRNAAEQWRGWEIWVRRDCLPDPGAGRYYWADLEGLQVMRLDGSVAGRLDHMLETGSADVMVIEAEQDAGHSQRWLVPFVPGDTVRDVDLAAGIIRVAWDFDTE